MYFRHLTSLGSQMQSILAAIPFWYFRFRSSSSPDLTEFQIAGHLRYIQDLTAFVAMLDICWFVVFALQPDTNTTKTYSNLEFLAVDSAETSDPGTTLYTWDILFHAREPWTAAWSPHSIFWTTLRQVLLGRGMHKMHPLQMVFSLLVCSNSILPCCKNSGPWTSLLYWSIVWK